MNYEPRNSIPTLFKDGLVPIALNSFMQKKKRDYLSIESQYQKHLFII